MRDESIYYTACEGEDYDVHVAEHRSQGWVMELMDYDMDCRLWRFGWVRGDRPAEPLKVIGERACAFCGSVTKEVRCGGCGAREG